MKLTAPREKISRSPAERHRRGRTPADDADARERAAFGARRTSLSITGTDLEVELVATSEVSVQQPGDITVPGRKLLDIFRALPEKTQRHADAPKASVSRCKAGSSRFTLSTLPAAEFPVVEEINAQQTLTVAQGEFRTADRQDAFFDGAAGRALLPQRHAARDRWQVAARRGDRRPSAGALRDGARRARRKTAQQVIVPRKGVLELQRILGAEGNIELAIGTNHVRAQIGDIRFTSKLIDGRFPEYGRVIPANPTKHSRGRSRCAAAGAAAHRDSLEREVSRRSADAEARSADDSGA